MTNLLKLGICFFIFSQTNEYNFNQKLTYEVTNLKKPENYRKVTYLINNQDNSFSATQINDSNGLHNVTFVDYNGIYWRGKFKNAVINKSVVTLDKSMVQKQSNPYKYQVDNYDFHELKDTILNNKVCKRFLLKSNDLKREKKKKLGREIYIIDPSSNSQPFLTFSTAYEIWKIRKNIPNGLLVEKYLYNYKGEMEVKEKLKNSETINLKFKLPIE